MNKKLLTALYVALLCSATTEVFAAEAVPGAIYKWIDSRGVTHYGDRPAPAGSQPRTERAIAKSDLAAGENMGASRQLATDIKNGTQARQDAGAAEKAAKDLQAQNAAREKACAGAREAVRVLEAGGRIATIKENGEKVVMDEPEIAGRTLEARKNMEEACAPPKPVPTPAGAVAPAAPAAAGAPAAAPAAAGASAAPVK